MAKKGTGHIYTRGATYWVKFYANGAPVYESTKSTKYEDALRLLRRRLTEADDGVFRARRAGRVLVAELLADLLLDYQANNPRSYRDFCEPIVRARLRPFWARYRASQVTTEKLLEYQAMRLGDGRAPGTVNREMALLRRAFNLGKQATPPKVVIAPHFPMLPEDNVRTGFLEHAQYLRLLAELPKGLKPLLVVGYHTGCRAGELLQLKWPQLDLMAAKITLYPGTTKNKQGRTIPIYGDMRPVLAIERQERDQSWPKSPWVFSRRGERIVSFRRSWDDACKRAGVSGLLFHDLRRSAVRNMVRAGIPERVAMAISGHKTRAIFDRYNIVSERDLQEAGERIEDFLAQKSSPTVTKTVTIEPQREKKCEAEATRKLLN
jgi:integrase